MVGAVVTNSRLKRGTTRGGTRSGLQDQSDPVAGPEPCSTSLTDFGWRQKRFLINKASIICLALAGSSWRPLAILFK